jgi:spore germination protein
MMIIAFMFGIIGIIAGMMILVVHLITLDSLGTPYGSPLSPFRWTDMKDSFVRFPAWKMIKRPNSAKPLQWRRAVDNRKKGDMK